MSQVPAPYYSMVPRPLHPPRAVNIDVVWLLFNKNIKHMPKSIKQLPAEIWQHDIVPYLNTGNRIAMHQTGQTIAKSVPRKPVCTPWECVWRPTLCSKKCDTFWSNISELLETVLWFLHEMTDAYDNMEIQFEMGSARLWLAWIPWMGLFHRGPDFNLNYPNPDYAKNYYKRVITDFFSRIHRKALRRTTNANTEDEEPFQLQLTIENIAPGGHRDISGLHKAVQHAFCRPQLMGNLHVYDVSTPVSVSILITDYPLRKAITTIPIYDMDGDIDMEHEPLWKSCT